MPAFDPLFDDTMDAYELALVAALTRDQLAEIDAALLAASDREWRKVARVVGLVMLDCELAFEELPVVFFTDRLATLVADGRLESRGDLRLIRFSEVRRVDAG